MLNAYFICFQNNFTIANLTYNSKYWVEVECDELTSPRVQFTTPGCSTPADKTFKRCLATSAVAQTTIGPGKGDGGAGHVASINIYDLDRYNNL